MYVCSLGPVLTERRKIIVASKRWQFIFIFLLCIARLGSLGLVMEIAQWSGTQLPLPCCFAILFFFFKILSLFIYFRERGRVGERKGEKHQCVGASPIPPTGNLAPSACALTGNRTSNPLLCILVLNPLSHTSQCCFAILNMCLLPHDPKWLLQFLPSNLQSSQEGEGRSGGHGLKIAHILSHLIGWSLVISPYYSKVSFRLYMGAPLKTLLLCKKEKLGSRGQLAVSLQEVSAQ